MVTGKGSIESILTDNDVTDIIKSGIPEEAYKNKKVLVLTPDATRTCPLPMMIRCINNVLGPKASKMDFLVALGTHTPLSQQEIHDLYGIDSQSIHDLFHNSDFFNHQWGDPKTFRQLATLSKENVDTISGGLLKEEVPIVINKKIYDYDAVLALGPVFPHEVVGYSGGAKYFFPGISGGEFLHFFHWLGAVITCRKTIGNKETPIRDIINLAMTKIHIPVWGLSMVVGSGNILKGFYAGDIHEAWSKAVALSSKLHVVQKDNPFHTVLGVAPLMYDEIWTAGKVMYKLEQVVADGGRLIIYGPHIKDISKSWGAYIEKTGYHVRDYFLYQMDRFKDIPRGVLAHATHVRGDGSCKDRKEIPRIDVILATAIPKKQCNAINLGYMNPDDILFNDYSDRENEGILHVNPAGETLYKLRARAK